MGVKWFCQKWCFDALFSARVSTCFTMCFTIPPAQPAQSGAYDLLLRRSPKGPQVSRERATVTCWSGTASVSMFFVSQNKKRNQNKKRRERGRVCRVRKSLNCCLITHTVSVQYAVSWLKQNHALYQDAVTEPITQRESPALAVQTWQWHQGHQSLTARRS